MAMMMMMRICAQTQTNKLPPHRGGGGGAPNTFISINPSDVNVVELRELFASANLSCHRFPNLDPNGNVQPVDLVKLRIALAHSSLLVSVFAPSSSSSSFPILPFSFPLSSSSSSRQLVGFGRAVSDNGLTASIHDVVVLPSLQGLGIGRRIVNRITRVLTNRGIYDISALCSGKERLFFEACGFGDDILESTTMIYTKTPSGQNTERNQMVVPAGRKLLLVPASKKPLQIQDNQYRQLPD